jgi:diguanylate cyclase (GGDEF)-like protein/PAS domain S-box-containing protein
MWNGTWWIRRDPTAGPDLPFEPAALDVEQLPPGVRGTVAALLASAGGPGWEARVRLSRADGQPCEVVVRSTGDATAEVEITGAGDPPPPPPPITEPAAGIAALDERLLELAHLGVWVIDTDGRTTFINRRMAELLGWDPEELRTRPLLGMVDDTDRWRVVSLFDRRQRGGGELHDVRFRRRDGSELWTILATTPVLDGDEVTAVITVVTDVTDRHERERELSEAEQRFRSSFEDAPIGKALVDADGRLLEVNRALASVLGQEPEHLTGARLGELIHPEDAGAARELTRRALDEALEGFHIDVRLRHADGHAVWVELDASLVRGDHAIAPRLVLHVEDISGRKAAESTGREAVARFQAAFTHAPIGMAIVELDGGIREANPGLCRMLGLDADVVRASNLLTLTDPDDLDDLEHRLAELREGRTRSLRIELRLIAADGHTLWTLLSAGVVEDDDGRPAYAVAQAEDITERRSAEHDLVHQTLHDPLTGLGNRILLKDQLHQALTIVGEVPFAVMFLDLDRFKSVNDTHGHDAGDALLIGVGERLRRIVRGGDTVARLGGDEFAIIAQGIADHRSASAMADKVRAALRAPFHVGSLDLTVTASVGVVIGSGEYATGDQLLRDADVAMYRAKDAGRDRHELFNDEIRLQEIERHETERTLRSALEDDRLRLLYQPIVDLHTGRPVGAEALLRIADPDQGMLRPRSFMSSAEDSRLILDLGAWVLDQVCAQLARWRDSGLGHLSAWVNVSGQELASPRFVAVVQRALELHRISAGRLHLECTENALLEATPGTLDHLRSLSESGVSIGIDDFGTGYSSLAYLRELPVAFLKVDRSFTRRLDEPGGTALVEAIVSLGRSLGLEIIAEGVESRRQVEALVRMGCGIAQGHLFARPAPAEAITVSGDNEVNLSWP